MKNQIKTILLLGVLTALMLWFGSLWGQGGLFIALAFVLLMNFGTYFFSDKIVLKMYKAKEVKEKDTPNLFNLVKEIAHDAKIPMPKVYVMPSDQSNAFACGRSPKHSSVAFTKGILNILTKEELKGVIAHEISHIKNRDTLIMVIASTIAGIISYLAFMARFAAIFGGFGGRDNRDGGNAMGLLIMAIITPIIAMLLQLAISRSREYMADEKGAKIIKNPKALASALEKLNQNVKHHPMRLGNKATSSLFIVNPFSAKGLTSLLSTHPSMKSRVERLRAMKL
ncbi:MAG: zinc metalloprotease HtpX [Nanoarchaeota archaeon]|nr:zinc metalloprotease HtpX [Nanoarchaeota archaeon]